jgi:hypothetical protein
MNEAPEDDFMRCRAPYYCMLYLRAIIYDVHDAIKKCFIATIDFYISTKNNYMHMRK